MTKYVLISPPVDERSTRSEVKAWITKLEAMEPSQSRDEALEDARHLRKYGYFKFVSTLNGKDFLRDGTGAPIPGDSFENEPSTRSFEYSRKHPIDPVQFAKKMGLVGRA